MNEKRRSVGDESATDDKDSRYIPPGGGVKAQIDASGERPSPAAQGLLADAGRQLSLGAPMLT